MADRQYIAGRTFAARRTGAEGLTLALSAAFVAHLGLVILMTRLFNITPELAQQALDILPVEIARVAPAKQPTDPPLPLEPPILRARVGDLKQPHDDMASDSFSESLVDGARAGQGRPAPNPKALTGDNLDDLRYRPYNHRSRDSLSRIRTRNVSATPDNLRRTPNPAHAPQLTSGSGQGKWRARGRGKRWTRRQGRAQRRVRGSGRQAEEARRQEERIGKPGTRPDPANEAHPGQLAQAQLRPELRRDAPTTLKRRLSRDLADRRNRQLASNALRPDMLDTARPTADGSDSGRGRGSVSGRRGDPNGQANGPVVWLSNPDTRFVDYFRRIHRKIQPLWRFPKHLEVLLEQGDVVVRFTILSDGRVKNVKVQKSSGYPGFDNVVVAAIQRAAPFGPIPAGLGHRLQVLAPFEFANPVVR